MRRLALALLLVPLLLQAGCYAPDHELVIENCGHQTIYVDIHKSYGPWWNPRGDDNESTPVFGFSSWIGCYTSMIDEIDVTVWRESDGEILYRNTFSEGDFGDFGNHIKVSIYP